MRFVSVNFPANLSGPPRCCLCRPFILLLCLYLLTLSLVGYKGNGKPGDRKYICGSWCCSVTLQVQPALLIHIRGKLCRLRPNVFMLPVNNGTRSEFWLIMNPDIKQFSKWDHNNGIHTCLPLIHQWYFQVAMIEHTEYIEKQSLFPVYSQSTCTLNTNNKHLSEWLRIDFSYCLS